MLQRTIKERLKRFARARLPALSSYLAGSRLLFDSGSYLYRSGWMESKRRGYPCLVNGEEAPWMNYPLIDFLQHRLTSDLRVFEFGGGYSTIFFSRRVAHVTTVEHDHGWLQQLQKTIPANVELIFGDERSERPYCRAIQSTGKVFDVVVVDGRDRVNCVRSAIDCLSPRGVILLDDARRKEHSRAFEAAKHAGFRVLEFAGLKPNATGTHATAIFYRSQNCLDL